MAIKLTEIRPDQWAQNGAWLHLQHPSTGKPLYEGDDKAKPVRVLVRGVDAPDARRKLVEYQAAMSKGRAVDSEAETAVFVALLVIDWENVEDENGPVACTPKAVRDLHGYIEWFGQQVIGFAMDRANFFSET